MSPGSSDAVRQVFGLALRQLRTQAGLSLRELGERAHYDYSRLSRAERGHHLMDPDLVRSLDEVLGTGGLLTLLRSLAQDEPVMPGLKTLPAVGFHDDDGDTVMLELWTPDGRSVQVSLSRREFAQLLSSGALGAVLPAGARDLDAAERVSKALAEPTRIDPQVISYFHNLLEQHFTADKMLGPRQLLSPVLAQIDVLDGLRKHARPGTTDAALRLLAQYAEFAGWLHQDAGDTAAAMWWSERASQWAQAVGDYQMVAYMLVRMSNIALLDHDAGNVIELAAAARKVPGPLSPKLVALAAQQEARGWALFGGETQFRSNLESAADLLREHPDDVDEAAPVYLHHYDLDTLEEQSASGYRVCGRAETAMGILERKIAQTPEHLHRDHGHRLAKLANTVLATPKPDPERAVELGLRCIATARSTGSARITTELRSLSTTLTRRWPSFSGTMAFREALAVT